MSVYLPPIKQSVNQNKVVARANSRYNSLYPGGVSELADEHDLGSCAARRGGSSPPFPTLIYEMKSFLCLAKTSFRDPSLSLGDHRAIDIIGGIVYPS